MNKRSSKLTPPHNANYLSLHNLWGATWGLQSWWGMRSCPCPNLCYALTKMLKFLDLHCHKRVYYFCVCIKIAMPPPVTLLNLSTTWSICKIFRRLNHRISRFLVMYLEKRGTKNYGNSSFYLSNWLWFSIVTELMNNISSIIQVNLVSNWNENWLCTSRSAPHCLKFEETKN